MNSIPVFYTPRMVTDSRSFSPSAAKPKQVVESWIEKFTVSIAEPTPVTVDELARAHDRTHVEDVLSCKTDNGFGNRSPEVAATLLLTSGAMLSAAREAMSTKTVAVAPVSGFHHAGTHMCEGFCTFNGLMVTALALRAENPKIRVAILDCDMHFGNGTDEIINTLNANSWVQHWTAGRKYFDRSNVDGFWDELDEILDWMGHSDVVLYQAGADPHVHDPHGGFLTTDELRRRDAVVFDYFKDVNVPVAWNLAGGYQIERDGSIPKVLEIHDNTMRECVRVYG